MLPRKPSPRVSLEDDEMLRIVELAAGSLMPPPGPLLLLSAEVSFVDASISIIRIDENECFLFFILGIKNI